MAFSSTLTINDGTTNRTFAETLREGRKVIRAETTAGTTSAMRSALVIDHTRDDKVNSTKPLRDLLKVSRSSEVSAVYRPTTAHVVITRDPLAPDSDADICMELLASQLTDAAFRAAFLRGES